MIIAIAILSIIGFLISLVTVFTAIGDGAFTSSVLCNVFFTCILSIVWWEIATIIAIIAIVISVILFIILITTPFY